MKALFFLYDATISIIDNMFSRRWWYVWFFQATFLLVLADRVSTDSKNSNLYILMMAWTTTIVILLNIEACYSDHLRSLLKKVSYLNMAKASMDELKAD
jgi:hypothetical protein